MARGLLLWYLLDTATSLRYKVSFNVAFNTLIFAVAGVPLLITPRAFKQV